MNKIPKDDSKDYSICCYLPQHHVNSYFINFRLNMSFSYIFDFAPVLPIKVRKDRFPSDLPLLRLYS